MAVTRKDITSDTTVRDKYIDGVLRLKQALNPQSGLSTYDALVVWHVRAMMTMTPSNQGSRNAARRRPVFLPWHRYLLLVYELQLQRVLQDTTFALPYWAWNRDGDLSADQQIYAPIWGTDYMGGSGDPVTTVHSPTRTRIPASSSFASRQTAWASLSMPTGGSHATSPATPPRCRPQ